MSAYLQWQDNRLYVENYNDDFLLLKAKQAFDISKIGTAIYQHGFDFIEEVIVTEVEICLKLNAKFNPAKIGWLKRIQLQEDIISHSLELPVFFKEHEDWKQIENYTGQAKEAIIERLLKQTYTVAMFGFLPGFTYLNGLDTTLHIPRKSVPAKYVEANSLAIGGKYLGVYSIASPGGWYVIGQIPFPILQLPKLPPTLWNLGDQVKLKRINQEEFESEKELLLRNSK